MSYATTRPLTRLRLSFLPQHHARIPECIIEGIQQEAMPYATASLGEVTYEFAPFAAHMMLPRILDLLALGAPFELTNVEVPQ